MKPSPVAKEVRDLVREHVEAVVAANPDKPRWRVAAELGMHPNTLARLLKKWQGEEDLLRERR